MDLEPAVGVVPAVSVRLAEIEDRVRRSVSAGRATSTIRAYRSDFSDFSTWCEMLGLSPHLREVLLGTSPSLAFLPMIESRRLSRRSPAVSRRSARHTASPDLAIPVVTRS